MPIMILSEHKNAYLDALEGADRGEYQIFVDFMLSRCLDTISLVNDSLRRTPSPTPDEGAAAINSLFVTKGGYTQEQVDEAGDRLFKLIQSEIAKIIAEVAGRNFRGGASPYVMPDLRIMPGSGHRLPAGGERSSTFLHIELTSSPPAEARVYRDYALWVPIDASGDDDIQVVRLLNETHRIGNQLGYSPGTVVDFGARLDDLVPTASGVLQIRVGLFAERVTGEMLAKLKSLAEKALRGQS